MILLGDQPQISPDVVATIIQIYQTTHSRIILPSYNMRRGHPILIHQYFFEEILSMPNTGSLKDFMNRNSEAIDYLVVDSHEVLEDIDSPEDYDRLKKNHSS
jgi:molybdenum cofactor cytidylyltransferase